MIGAGFAGLRMLHELRQLGLSVNVIEAASRSSPEMQHVFTCAAGRMSEADPL